MKRDLSRFNLRTSYGIATGVTVCGTFGNSFRRSYTMLGDLSEFITRLVHLSRDDTLCDEETYQSAKNSIAFEKLPEVKEDGNTMLLSVYRPLGEIDRIHLTDCRVNDLVGRSKQLETLADRVKYLSRTEKGSVVIIEAESG